MGDELIDIYDSKNRPLNKKVMKSEAHKKGLWHRVAHVWIYNSNKEVLLQLRSKDKDVYPNKWDISVAGHVGAGEREIQSAMREIEEEIGLKVKESELQLWNTRNIHFISNNLINNEIIYLYLLKHDVDVNELKIQKEEIQKIKFFNLNELYKDLKEHPEKYTHIEYFFEMIDKIRSL